jgi:rhodanese-related sulfurtransferase
MKTISAAEARNIVHADDEIAFLDVREAGQFVEGHPLFAIPLPFSQLELGVERLLPRRSVATVILDDGDGVAQKAAEALKRLGYSSVMTVDGGMDAWEKAEFPVYKGVNVPSKTLGELAEVIWHPPMITADDLEKLYDDGNELSFFDVRPDTEYCKMRVPMAVCAPNGELAHRADALIENPTRTAVLTCAGRTRGITGVIGLMAAGYHGPVFALENGTQGWALSGRALERGNVASPLPQLRSDQTDASRERARAMVERYGLPTAHAVLVQTLRADPARTTFLFDVRSHEEAVADPVTGAVHAPGVQLVQATDQFVGVRHARLVLCCDTGLRSAIAAFWLKQLGYEVYVASLDHSRPESPDRQIDNQPTRACEHVEAAEISANPGDYFLIDVRHSPQYRAGHVIGAEWSVRPRLDAALRNAGAKPIAFVDDGDGMAGLCAADATDMGFKDVRVVRGGHGALLASGCAIEATGNRPTDTEAIDFAAFVHDRHDGNLEASRRYLEWETGLVAQLDDLERQAFRLITPLP